MRLDRPIQSEWAERVFDPRRVPHEQAHVVPPSQEGGDAVASDEPGAAGDDDPQADRVGAAEVGAAEVTAPARS